MIYLKLNKQLKLLVHQKHYFISNTKLDFVKKKIIISTK